MSKRKAMAVVGIVTGAMLLALTGGVIRLRAALAQTEGIRVTAQTRTIAGVQEGEVLLGDSVVIRIRSGAGGMTAPQRAEQVANRLQELLGEGQVRPEEIRVATVNGEQAVMVGNTVIVTADAEQAALNNTTPRRLASTWRNNLESAVSQQVAGYRSEQTARLAEENTSSKLVPIVSLGSGLRVGAARITGPADRVRQASLVGQIDTAFQSVARIRIFIPLESVTDIRRVPQVNVTAYGNVRL